MLNLQNPPRPSSKVDRQKITKSRGLPQQEKEIERSILAYLRLKKITAWKQNNGALKVGNRFVKFAVDEHNNQIKGIPDILGWMPDGKSLFIEVKKPKRYPSPDQRAFLANAQKANCVAFVARSIADVQKVFKENGY